MSEVTITERQKQFKEEMKSAGFSVHEYSGRNFYRGPAIECDRDELQEVIRSSRLELIWDQMGKSGLVVYPK